MGVFLHSYVDSQVNRGILKVNLLCQVKKVAFKKKFIEIRYFFTLPAVSNRIRTCHTCPSLSFFAPHPHMIDG